MSEKLDPKELRKVAEAATPGPWFREYSDVVVREPDPRDVKFYDDPRNMRIVRGAEHLKLRDKQGIANATHIATFDPTTVLALLSRLEQAEQQVARVRELASNFVSLDLPDADLRGTAWEAAEGAQSFARQVLEALDGEQDA